MASRVYACATTEIATTAAVDVCEILAADDKPVDVLGWVLAQSTDFGDAADEIIPYIWYRGNTTSGSGGSTVTAQPVSGTGAAAGATVEMNNTTAASAGTAVALYAGGFNVRAGEVIWLPEGCELTTSGANLLCLRLGTAPADSIDLSATVFIREQG